MSLKSLLIRADSGPEVGLGHIMRTLAIAEAAADAGVPVAIISPPLPTSVRARMDHRHIPHRQPEAAGDLKGDLILIDGYRFPANAYDEWKASFSCLAVIDDTGEKKGLPADVVINPGVHATQALYQGWHAPKRFFLGPRFLPLRQEFGHAASRHRTYQTANRLLVSLGGSDPKSLTAPILEDLTATAPWPLEIRAVMGALTPALPPLFETGLHRIAIERDVADMATSMAWADVAITAAGSSIWELACLGVPAVAVVTADNQRPGAEAAAQKGMILLENAEQVAEAAVRLLADPDRRRKMAAIGRRTVDGKGAHRIIAALREACAG